MVCKFDCKFTIKLTGGYVSLTVNLQPNLQGGYVSLTVNLQGGCKFPNQTYIAENAGDLKTNTE